MEAIFLEESNSLVSKTEQETSLLALISIMSRKFSSGPSDDLPESAACLDTLHVAFFSNNMKSGYVRKQSFSKTQNLSFKLSDCKVICHLVWSNQEPSALSTCLE